MNKPDDSSPSTEHQPPARPSVSAAPRSTAPNERWFTVAALALVWAGALAALWSVLARQSPASPYLVRGIYELVEGLSTRLWIIAAVTLVCARLARLGSLFTRENSARAWVIFALWSAGTVLNTGSIAWSASSGAMAIQVRDSGQRGHGALVLRWLGAALLLGSLALSHRAILRGARAEDD
jgi:hypothetical protein